MSEETQTKGGQDDDRDRSATEEAGRKEEKQVQEGTETPG